MLMNHFWFLDHAWLIPLIPAISYAVILLFGKRYGERAAWIGLASIGSAWVLALGTVVQWISHVNDSEGAEARGVVQSIGGMVRNIRLAAESKLHVEPIIHSTTWFQNNGFKLNVGIQIDGLAVMMLFVVTTISLLVHFYSTEYLKGDRRFNHYYAALSLFSASMLFLVVASSTLQLLAGWELVGLCSFMLIGHWWEEKPNSNAALKAFLTTRTGDIGLLTGVIMTFFVVQKYATMAGGKGTGSFDIMKVNEAAIGLGEHGGSKSLLFWCAAALLLAIMGKSGQFPLHTWLPDAMAGPTPVSALIHAATMVVAGVYLGARVYPIFYQGFHIAGGTINPMAAIGGATVIIGAGLAFVQNDIKKVLAYSTISQLGYMVMALGVGAWTAAIFHLFTHAFFKANLFLGAGSVSHSGANHSFDMKHDMGGLRKYMPKTFITFMIGTAALIGIPFTAGFFSKDEILAVAGENNFTFFKYLGLVGAVMTACYMTRCVYLTFFGEYRGGHADAHGAGHDVGHDVGHDTHAYVSDDHATPIHDDHAAHAAHDLHDAHDDHGHHGPHESNFPILAPLFFLSFMSIASGYLLSPMLKIEKFALWVEPHFGDDKHFNVFEPGVFKAIDPILAVAAGVVGMLLAYAFYWKKAYGENITERNGALRAGKNFLVNKYYLDVLYTDIIVGGVKGPIAQAAYWVNQNVIDNVLRYTGKGAAGAAQFVYKYIDQKGVDGVYNGSASGAGALGGLARKLQTGRVQLYAFTVLFGLGAIALLLVIFN